MAAGQFPPNDFQTLKRERMVFMQTRRWGIFIFLLALAVPSAVAGPLRERLRWHAADAATTAADDAAGAAALPLPAGARAWRDVAYGGAALQRMDVYAPANARGAPVILMVHGGGWRRGDKTARTVVENKIARWVPRGFVFISINYRLLPDANPLQQANDVAQALAKVQTRAASWGGDPHKIILMGHSAGAHLVALLSAQPAMAARARARPWLGSVLLDSGALDVEAIMTARHAPLFDAAFGSKRDYWQASSPQRLLSKDAPPLLVICSSRRDTSCAQAEAFVAKGRSLGVRAAQLSENLSHRDINDTLGETGEYTRAVETFMASLNPGVAARLK